MSGCRLEARTVDLALDGDARLADLHLAVCESCTIAVREARAFEGAVRAAARSLVLEPLPSASGLGLDRRITRPTRLPGVSRWWTPVLATLAVGALMLGAVVRFAPVGMPSVAAGPSVPPASPVASAMAPVGSPSPLASTPAPTVPPAPGASPSAICLQAWGVAIKSWSMTGGGQITVMPVDKVALARGARVLSKAFAVCSPAELRVVNGQVTIVYPVKVAGAGGVRYVSAPLIATFDRTAAVLCSDHSIAATRACVALVGPSPAASRSP